MYLIKYDNSYCNIRNGSRTKIPKTNLQYTDKHGNIDNKSYEFKSFEIIVVNRLSLSISLNTVDVFPF